MSGMSDVIVVAVAGCTACPPRCTSLDAGNVCSCWRRIGLPRTRHPTPLVAYVRWAAIRIDRDVASDRRPRR
jgi:hypothetical protein